MWFGLSLLIFLLIVAAAGLTGFATYDSRDTRYNLTLARGIDPRPTYESLVAPVRRRPVHLMSAPWARGRERLAGSARAVGRRTPS
jgi:hypothetical protein